MSRIPTVDELVSTLVRSSIPTVIIEGSNDERIYRWIEKRMGAHNANMLPVGGRKKLLRVFNRRYEFAHLPVAFVADRDMWAFSGVPDRYRGVLFTKGYSIENDLYATSPLEGFLDDREADEHKKVLESIIRWFAFEVQEHLSGRAPKVGHHCYEVVPLNQTGISARFKNKRGFSEADAVIRGMIKSSYKMSIRGKTLFEVLARFLSASDRSIKHSKGALVEIAFKTNRQNPNVQRIVKGIETQLSDTSN